MGNGAGAMLPLGGDLSPRSLQAIQSATEAQRMHIYATKAVNIGIDEAVLLYQSKHQAAAPQRAGVAADDAPAPAENAEIVPINYPTAKHVHIPQMKMNLGLKLNFSLDGSPSKVTPAKLDVPKEKNNEFSKFLNSKSSQKTVLPTPNTGSGGNSNGNSSRAGTSAKGLGGGGHSLKSIKSLRSFAQQHRSRHENSYIPQQTMIFASRGLIKKTVDGRRSLTNVLGSGNSLGSHKGGAGTANQATQGNKGGTGGNSSENSFNLDFDLTVDRNVMKEMAPAAASPGTSGKRPAALKIHGGAHHSNMDDADWIQVSDDEDNNAGNDDEKSAHRRAHQALGRNGAAEGSYVFTQSGTIFVDGFHDGGLGIRVDGIARESIIGSRLNMKDRVTVLCRLGSGASSVVYKALDLRDMRLVALKMVSVNERSKRRQVGRELSTLFQFLKQKPVVEPTPVQTPIGERSSANPRSLFQKQPYEYVVDFYDAFSNIDEGGIALMIEYMDGGSLQDIVAAGGCDDEKTLASIALQALTGLYFLHSCAQLHRDLKPGNFLISNKGEVKVGDFGILREMNEPGRRALSSTIEFGSEDASPDNMSNSNGAGITVNVDVPPLVGAPTSSPLQRAHTFVGTATYMSPERIDGREYSYPSDIWAFGLSLLTVSLGKMPIDTKGGYWSILQSIRDNAPPSVPLDSGFSEEYRDFISKSLRTNPDERWNCAQLLKHPFLLRAAKEESEGDNEAAGLEELRTILSALHLHLTNMQTELLDPKRLQMIKNGTAAGDGALTKNAEEVADFDVFFGGLFRPNGKVVDLMRSIIFGSFIPDVAQPTKTATTPLDPAGRKDASNDGESASESALTVMMVDTPTPTYEASPALPHRLQALASQLSLSLPRLTQEVELLLYEIEINGNLEHMVRTPRTSRR
jgi:serine/threonine protein kinase